MRAMFIIGSPHGARSTSNSLADRLVKHLEEVGWETVKAMAGRAMSPTELNGRAVECLESDLLVIASPLYVDQLPSPCIEFMEAIRRESGGPGRRPDLAAVINCGFPEASQNRVALLICHEFALACGMTWRGGLSLGAGPMVGGRPLDQLGGALRNVATALDIAGEALSRGEDISERAYELMSRRMFPTRLYAMMGNRMWRKAARGNGVLGMIDDTPLSERGPRG